MRFAQGSLEDSSVRLPDGPVPITPGRVGGDLWNLYINQLEDSGKGLGVVVGKTVLRSAATHRRY